jgi:hypothetical protein
MMLRRFVLLACFPLLAACTTASDQRAGAHDLTLASAKLQRELNEFATIRTKADVDRHVIANNLEARALSLEAANAIDVKSWELAGDKGRVALFNSLVSAADAAADREKSNAETLARNEQLVSNTKSRIATRADELGALQKTLGALARNDKLRDSFKFYESFIGEVKETVDKAKKASADAATAASATLLKLKEVVQ